MTLPFGTRVTERHTDPNLCGIVRRLANDAAEYGEEEYVIVWPSGLETLERRADLTVIPDPLALRVVRDLNPNGQDVVWGYVAADGRVTGIPHPHRIVPRVRDDAASAYIVGPDPALLVPEKT